MSPIKTAVILKMYVELATIYEYVPRANPLYLSLNPELFVSDEKQSFIFSVHMYYFLLYQYKQKQERIYNIYK